MLVFIINYEDVVYYITHRNIIVVFLNFEMLGNITAYLLRDNGR